MTRVSVSLGYLISTRVSLSVAVFPVSQAFSSLSFRIPPSAADLAGASSRESRGSTERARCGARGRDRPLAWRFANKTGDRIAGDRCTQASKGANTKRHRRGKTMTRPFSAWHSAGAVRIRLLTDEQLLLFWDSALRKPCKLPS